MGGAERSRRGSETPKELTGVRCAEIARVLREGLARVGITLQPHHDLDKDGAAGGISGVVGSRWTCSLAPATVTPPRRAA